jgi:ArsR family transcriptional regulator
MHEYSEEVKLLKALTHPARLAILEILRDGEQCVCHIESILQRRQAYISQQLMVLRDAGLLKDRRVGLNIYYRVVRPEIYSVLDAAHQMSRIPAANLVHISGACICPSCKEHDAY